MDAVKIQQSESLWSFANDLREITYKYSSEVSRIANETHETRSGGLCMVERVAFALEMAERARSEAEWEYDNYVYNSGDNYDLSYASQLKDAVRAAREYENEVRKDYEIIRNMMDSLATYCSSLYSRLSSEGGMIQSMGDSVSQKILTEYTIISDYNAS